MTFWICGRLAEFFLRMHLRYEVIPFARRNKYSDETIQKVFSSKLNRVIEEEEAKFFTGREKSED